MSSRWVQWVSGVASAGTIAASSTMATAENFADWRAEMDRVLPPGAVVADVDVGGLEPEEAIAAVEDSFAEQLDAETVVRFDDETWTVTPRELGATTDVAVAIGRALAAAAKADSAEWWQLFLFDRPLEVSEDAGWRVPDDAIDRLVGDIAEVLDQEPVDASLDWSSGWIEVVEHRTGREVDRHELARVVDTALHDGGGEVEVRVDDVEPAVSTSYYDTVILLRQDERRVHLVEQGEVTRSYPVAVGAADSPTPTGQFHVGAMRSAPTWVNPAPSGWGADMPARIDAGDPANPLGQRAINWNRYGGGDTLIRFHGTPATHTIGQATSNGCVRMFNPDVIDLFNRVSTGMPIVSIQA